MNRLTDNQMADLSAWIDGELTGEHARQIADLVRNQPAWASAHRELTALDDILDAWSPAPAPADLAERILAAANGPQVSQQDLDDLSALHDGELSADASAELRDRLATNPALQAEQRQLVALDDLLDAWHPPHAPADLPERILARADQPSTPRVLKLSRWIVPAAAAAAIIIVALAMRGTWTGERTPDNNPTGQTPVVSAEQKTVNSVLRDIPADDRFVVENLRFAKDLAVVEHMDTILAMEQLESQGS